MLIKNIDEQTIALAGLYQCCHAVSEIAWSGKYNQEDFIPLINSILKLDSSSVKDIYININTDYTLKQLTWAPLFEGIKY